MKWTIPEMWSGETVYIIGGGPSIDALDFARLAGRKVIALNSAFEDGAWPICYFQDNCWFTEDNGRNEEKLKNFSGMIVTCSWQLASHPTIFALKRGVRLGFSSNRDDISYGTNTGYGAINLATKLGASRIVLFGYDMQKIDDRHNYHSRHTRPIHDSVYQDDFIRAFNYCVAPLTKLGVEVINATPGSALKVFPIITMEEGLCI